MQRKKALAIAGANGFGRFGLNLLKTWLEDKKPAYKIRYWNDEKLSPKNMYKIIKSDPHVSFDGYKVLLDKNTLSITTPDGREEIVECTSGPAESARWIGKPDIFFECSGSRTAIAKSKPFLKGNTKIITISATSWDADGTFLFNYNHHEFKPEKHKIISYGSCTVNGYIPLAAFLHKKFGVLDSAVNIIHNIQQYRLPNYNTLDRRFCTLEKQGPAFLPFLRKNNFMVNYTVVPYSGASIMDMSFRLKKRVSREKLLRTIKNAIKKGGELYGLYTIIPKNSGPEPHVRSPYNAAIVENALHMRDKTAHLFTYFYNEGATRYHELTSHVAKQIVKRMLPHS